MASTLAAVLPSSLHTFWNPNIKTFVYALINSSLAFFLFSFQVHEKSILLPAFMASLVYLDHPKAVVWFQNVAVFSMLPLLFRDKLGFPSIILLLLWSSLTKLRHMSKSRYDLASLLEWVRTRLFK